MGRSCPLLGDVRRAWGVWWRLSRAEGACARPSKSNQHSDWYLTFSAPAPGLQAAEYRTPVRNIKARVELVQVCIFLSIAIFIVCDLRDTSALFANVKDIYLAQCVTNISPEEYPTRDHQKDCKKKRGSLLIRRNTLAFVLSRIETLRRLFR